MKVHYTDMQNGRDRDDESSKASPATGIAAKAAPVKASPGSKQLRSPRLDQETVSFGGSDVEPENPLYSGGNQMPYVVTQKPPTPELGGKYPEWPWDANAGFPPAPDMRRINRGIPSSEPQLRLHEAEEKAAVLEQKVAALEEDLQLEKLSNEQLRSNRDSLNRDEESEQTQLRADLESSAREERFQRERAAKFEEQVKELEEELHLEQLSSKSMQQERDRLTDQVAELSQRLSTSEQSLAASQVELTTLQHQKGKLESQVAAQAEGAKTKSADLETKGLEMDQLRTEVAQLTSELSAEKVRATSLQDSLKQLRAEKEVIDSEHAAQIQRAHLQREQLMQELQELSQIRHERDHLQSKLGTEQGEAVGHGHLSVPVVSEVKRISIKDEIESSLAPQQLSSFIATGEEDEKQKLQQRVDSLQQRLEEFLGVREENQALTVEITEKAGQIQRLETQLQDLQEKVKAPKGEPFNATSNKHEKQQLQQRANNLEQTLEKMSEELQNVKEEKETLATEITEKAGQTESLQKQVEELKEKVKEKTLNHVARTLRQKMEERHGEPEDHKSKEAIANLQRELDITVREKERALENLQKAEAQSVRVGASLAAKQDEIDELRRNNTRLVTEVAIQSKQSEKALEAQNAIKSMEDVQKKLEVEHAGMAERVKILDEQLGAARAGNEQLVCEHAVLKDKYTALQQNDQDSRTSVQENAALAERAKLLEDQLNSTSEAKDSVTKELAVTSLKLEQLEEKFEAKEKELNALREELEEDLQEVRNASEARLEELQEAQEELQEAHDASQASLEEAQASLEELQVAHATSQASLAASRASLAEANERWEAHLAEVKQGEDKLQSTEASTEAPDIEQSKIDEESQVNDERRSQGNDEKEEKAPYHLPGSRQFAPRVAVYDHTDAEMGLKRIIRIQVPGRHMHGDAQSSVSGTVQPLANGVLVSLSKLPDVPHDAEVVQPYFMIDQTGTWEWKYEPLDGPWGFCESWGLAHGILAIVLQRLKDGEVCALSEEKRVQRVKVKRSSSVSRASTSRGDKPGRESLDLLSQKTPRNSLTLEEDKQPQGEKVKRRSSHKTKRGSETKESSTSRASSLTVDPGLANKFQALHAVVAAQSTAGRSVRMQFPSEMAFISKSGQILHAGSLSVGTLLRGPYGLVKVSALCQVRPEGRSAMRLYLGIHALSVLPEQQLLARCIGKDEPAASQWEVVQAQELSVNCHELSLHGPGGVEDRAVLTAVKRMSVHENSALSLPLLQVELIPQSLASGLERCGLFVAMRSAMPKAIHPAVTKSPSAPSLLDRSASNSRNPRGSKAISASPIMGSTMQKASRAAPTAAKRRSASQSAPQGRGLGAAAVLAEQLALQDADPSKARR